MFVSKHYGLQKSLFGEIVFDDDFHKIKTTPGRMNDDDDFNNAKTCKIYNVLNDVLYIGVTCDALKTCLFLIYSYILHIAHFIIYINIYIYILIYV
jgi:hypothetical protein